MSPAAAAWAALLLTAGVAHGLTSFGYNTDDELGPDKWANEYQSCGGKYQSPVDIEERLVRRVALRPLRFQGISQLPYTSLLTNNGHTVQLKINNTEPIIVSGGPLRGNYTFEQLHFHWGVNDSAGSEDRINNQSYSMELHMVFFKTSYGKVENAMNYKDGLAVIALFFQISEMDNKVYSELVDSLRHVITPDSKVELHYQFPLEFMLPHNRNNYFTYNGSLTTPPCSEIVTWIEFKHPVLLSHSQLATFRKLRSFHGALTHNVRPVQPLHGRPVLYNIGQPNNNSSSVTNINIFAWISIIFYHIISYFNIHYTGVTSYII